MIDFVLKLLSHLFVYFAQPQIRIYYKKGASGSGVAPNIPSGIECEWKGNLVFENITELVAVDLQLLDAPAILEISPIPQNSIRPYESVEVKVVARKSFPREVVIACKDRFVELLPEEIGNLKLQISYQNLKGKLFYTKYHRILDKDSNTYHFVRPKA